ncbi:MAG TPA: GNAT family N-acetyltransferase [Candidatus Nitrosotalea sp.]|nr:GNAT family N-acetyltransferase [Candidatus Nitrosotalea sp.]
MRITIGLKPVDTNDIDFLHELFKERTKYLGKLRFRKKDIPTYKDHKKFVTSFISNRQDHPYESWDIILYENRMVGALVLKKDGEWGYHVLMNYQNKGIGQQALFLLIKRNPKKTLVARINPDNDRAQHIAKKFGHKLAYLTFVRNP